MSRGGMFGFLLYLIVGLFLINSSLNLFDASFLSSIEKWIVLAGGILAVFGGISYLRSRRFY